MMINLDPDTGTQDARVLKTVVRLNNNNAGVYGTVVQTGTIRVGQPVSLVLDARRFGSTDVHGASRLVAELLGRFPNARDLRPDTAGIGRRLRSATRSLLRG
jgi:hypothetical protein